MARLAMGELEGRVLDVLWDRDDWMTPGEVHQVLDRKRNLAYTTVMTILVRLWRKGLLEREREGKAFAYRPVQSREERAASRMADVLKAGGDRSVALSHFVDSMTATERAKLRQMLGRSKS
jgi:predicted transcriptional regulator